MLAFLTGILSGDEGSRTAASCQPLSLRSSSAVKIIRHIHFRNTYTPAPSRSVVTGSKHIHMGSRAAAACLRLSLRSSVAVEIITLYIFATHIHPLPVAPLLRGLIMYIWGVEQPLRVSPSRCARASQS